MTVVPSTRVYAGKPVADRRAERRARFIDAALTVFSANSYANSTVTDLCEQAGLSRRQFYEEFTGREDLLVATYDELQSEAREAIVAAIAASESEDVREIAIVAMTALIQSVGCDPRRARVSFVEIVGVSAAVEEHRMAVRHQWGVLLETLARAVTGVTTAPPGGWRLAGVAFISAINGVIHQWSVDDPQQPIEDLVTLLSNILLSFVTSPGHL